MRKLITTALTTAALTLVATPLAAIADGGPDEPVADALATQNPGEYSSFIDTPCETRRSVDCYWDAIGQTGEAGQSYFAIRVGREVCIRYWDASYNRKHGFCKAIRS